MNILLVKPRPHKDSINLQSFMLCEPLELEYKPLETRFRVFKEEP